MSDTDRTGWPGLDRIHVGIAALAVGVACILSLARLTHGVGGLEAAVALLGVGLLAGGTVVVGTSAQSGV